MRIDNIITACLILWRKLRSKKKVLDTNKVLFSTGAGVFLLASAESEQISFLFDCIVRGISPTRGPFGLRPVLPGQYPMCFNICLAGKDRNIVGCRGGKKDGRERFSRIFLSLSEQSALLSNVNTSANI